MASKCVCAEGTAPPRKRFVCGVLAVLSHPGLPFPVCVRVFKRLLPSCGAVSSPSSCACPLQAACTRTSHPARVCVSLGVGAGTRRRRGSVMFPAFIVLVHFRNFTSLKKAGLPIVCVLELEDPVNWPHATHICIRVHIQ